MRDDQLRFDDLSFEDFDSFIILHFNLFIYTHFIARACTSTAINISGGFCDIFNVRQTLEVFLPGFLLHVRGLVEDVRLYL